MRNFMTSHALVRPGYSACECGLQLTLPTIDARKLAHAQHKDSIRARQGSNAETCFWAKVRKTETCWLWQGGTNGRGYGSMKVGERRRYVHRFAYELLVGPIPAGREIDHICRVRRCVNPAHLRAVTHRENVLCGTSPVARQAQQTHCLRGHEFTETNTRRRKNGKRSCRVCQRDRDRIRVRDRRYRPSGPGHQPVRRALSQEGRTPRKKVRR